MMKTKFRTAFEPRLVAVSFKGVKSLTDQQYKDDCSIEGIIKRYGCVPQNDISPMIADVSDIGDFAECFKKVQEGLDNFAALPADLRARFGNDPKAFYAWFANPDNLAEAVKLGLAFERKEEKPLAEVLDNLANKIDEQNRSHREAGA